MRYNKKLDEKMKHNRSTVSSSARVVRCREDIDKKIRQLWSKLREMSDLVTIDDFSEEDLNLWTRVTEHSAVQKNIRHLTNKAHLRNKGEIMSEDKGETSKQNQERTAVSSSAAVVRRAIYREDDWKAEVEILEDRSDDGKEDFTLRVVKSLRESRIYKPTEDGHVFNFFKLKGISMSGLGHLEILSA